MSPPRKPRSPGQRSFGGDGMGSPAEWRKVAQSPHVKRMLKDPQLASALYQNFRQTGGQMPQQTPGMADGGGVPTPEELNRLAQMRGGDVDPYTGNQLEELAQDSRPVRPMRFDTGGYVSDQDVQDAQKAVQDAKNAHADQQTVDRLEQKYLDLQQRRAQALQSAATPGAVSLGNAGQMSSQTMQGLQKLSQAGPPTAGNIATSTLLGAAMGGMGTGSGAGALIGGATAGLLNYFLRKQGQAKLKQQQQQQQQQSGSGGSAYASPTPTDPNGAQSPPQSGQTRRAMQMQPDGTVKYTNVPYAGNVQGSYSPAPQSAAGPQLPPGPGLWQGSANVPGGVVTSSDGKTWQDQSGKPVDASQVGNQTQLKSFDQPTGSSDLMNLPINTNPANLPTMGTGLGALDQAALDMDSIDTGLAKGGPVLEKPHGMPIPVLHIAIIAKPKGKPPLKRAMGGDIPQAERRPRRPHAIPPIAGPESSGVRLPHGRVQVPKGSGAAIRGKRFGGVF